MKSINSWVGDWVYVSILGAVKPPGRKHHINEGIFQLKGCDDFGMCLSATGEDDSVFLLPWHQVLQVNFATKSDSKVAIEYHPAYVEDLRKKHKTKAKGL